MGLIPSLGRFHMLRSNEACMPHHSACSLEPTSPNYQTCELQLLKPTCSRGGMSQLLSSCAKILCYATREPTVIRSQHIVTKYNSFTMLCQSLLYSIVIQFYIYIYIYIYSVLYIFTYIFFHILFHYCSIPPLAATRESPCKATKTHCSQNINK